MASLEPLPYYKWLWRDWRSNRRVAKMHFVARGLYRELLDEQWAEGSIPDDSRELSAICGCPKHVIEEYWPEIAECFEPRPDGRLVNAKMERQRTEQDAKRIKLADSGRAGGISKASNRQHSLPLATPVPYSRAEHEHEQEQSKHSASPPNPPPPVEPAKPDPVIDAVTRLFAYYCDAFGRDPRKYSLTDMRRSKAEARMRERIRAHLGDAEKAEMDLIRAIENLSMSEFHRSQGFTDWIDQIFRSQETFEKRLNMEQKGGFSNGKQSNGTTKTGGTIDALERARAVTRRRAAPGGHPDVAGEARSTPPGAP